MQPVVHIGAGAPGARIRWGPSPRAFGSGLALFALLAVGCSEPVPPTVTEPKPPGLESEPRWLTFKCVKPGCDETLDVTIRQVGARKLAIKRVVLSEPDRTEYSIESELSAPAIVNEQFKVSVRYRPIGGPVKGDVKLLVTYTDASPEEGEGRIPPGEVSVPLLRRLVGEPVLVASPARLVFGAVSPGESRSLPLTVSNAGSGNSSLVISAVDSDEPTIGAQALPALGLAPGSSTEVQMGYAPQAAAYSEARLLVRSAGDMVAPVEVLAVGTSLPDPTVAALPAEGLDFGRVEKGTQKRASIEVVNRGGAPLELESVRVVGNANLAATLPNEATSLTLAPLESVEVMVWLSSETSGDIDAYVELTTNDPSARLFSVPVVGMVTAPHAVAPGSIDFGKVPKGWVLTRPITVQNEGWGELEVKGLTLVLGSSDLFTLRSLPSLPLSLERHQKLGLEVEFRAEAMGPFQATLSVETNDPGGRFLEVPIRATGSTCAEGCPLENAVPSCVGNECSIASCESGWFDTDGEPENGCECSEIGNDPGSSCQEAHYLGEFPDDGTSQTFRGILPWKNDVDTVTFFAKDAFNWGADRYDVRISLASADPSIRLCVYWHETGNHLSECYLENENCPESRSFQRTGTGGGDDADYVVKIYREPGAAPTCKPYTLSVSNG
ncbi:MAG TPA: hypothetical protein DFS52_00440 [Myxococcales bacterium]|nr:hypothetical protein [Myxococcales bacterium]